MILKYDLEKYNKSLYHAKTRGKTIFFFKIGKIYLHFLASIHMRLHSKSKHRIFISLINHPRGYVHIEPQGSGAQARKHKNN